MLGEGWNDIMYMSMRSVSGISAAYYVALVCFGNIIMLNLFLAILLGNFDKARNFGQKKKVFEAFKEILGLNKSLSETLDIILGDMSVHVKTKVLLWDAHQVQKQHRQGDTQIAQDLTQEGARFCENTDSVNNLAPFLVDKAQAQSHTEIKSQVTDQYEHLIKKGRKKKGKKEKDPDMEIIEEEEAPNSGTSPLKKKGKHLDVASNRRAIRYSKILEKVHKTNPLLKRTREFNRQYAIMPYPGLREILSKKKNLDNIKSLSVLGPAIE